MPKTRFLMIGLDGLMVGYLEELTADGRLPNLARLMARGAYSRILPAFPVDTPTNWTSFATGAWPGTHGIVGFHVHEPGDPIATVHETLHTGACHSEYLWDVAEREGMNPFLLTYPGAWPSTMENGLVIQGMHGDVTFSPGHAAPPPSRRQTIDSPAVYYGGADVKDSRNIAREIAFAPLDAGAWDPPPASARPPLEAVIPVSANSGLEWSAMGWLHQVSMEKTGPETTLRLVLTASGDGGYDRLEVYRSPRAEARVAALLVGQWSDFLRDGFTMENGETVGGHYRFKLMELAPDASRVAFYRSKIYKSRGWCSDADAEREIADAFGPFIYGFEQGAGYCDVDLFLEHTRRQAANYVRLAGYALDRRGCDFMMVKIHVQDALNHWLLNEFLPEWSLYDATVAEKRLAQYEQSYVEVDRMVGDLIERVADENTVVCVASDHGALPIPRKIDCRPALCRAGLCRYVEQDGQWILDAANSRTVPLGDQIYLNLKGREKDGVVDPSEYEAVRDAVIHALRSAVDPATGRSPFVLVARKEDLAMHGVWGPRYGDVLPVAREGYWIMGGEIMPHVPSPADPATFEPVTANDERPICGTHFGMMPNATMGLASNHAFMFLAGPGLAKGYRRLRCAPPTALAPTACHALGMPTPRDCEAGALPDFLA